MQELFDKLPDWLRDFDYERYLSNNYVVLDFETTILDKGSPYNKDNKVVCSSYRVGADHAAYGGGTTITIGSEFKQEELISYIESADFWVAHNSKFEYGWLERCGLPLHKSLTFCTMLAEYVLLSNKARMGSLSLDACLSRRGYPSKDSVGKALLKSGVCPSTWPESILKKYSGDDTELTELLFLDQRNYLIEREQVGTAFTRNILTPALVSMESKGMHLDKHRVEVVTNSYRKEMEEVRTELNKFLQGANPNSPKQMREFLYEQLKFPLPKDKKWLGKDGKTPTTSPDYINTAKATTKKQKEFKQIRARYSKINAALTKSLNKFFDCVNQTEDHILTAVFNQAITATQRLSSSGRNFKTQFQNFARIFKPLFNARRKGWKITEIDQAQLEYRVAVFLGQDAAGLADILNKVDAHAFTAEHIFGDKFINSQGAERSEMRTDAKSRTFKPLYGGQSGTTAEKKYYKAFQEKHKGITEVQNKWKMSALNTGEVRIPSGLIFYFPNTRVTSTGYITNTTNICNYPVQSFATADIVPIGVTYQWYLMIAAELQSFLINTVHDSSITETHPDEIEQVQQIGEYAYVDVVYKYLNKVYNVDFNVPLEAECKTSDYWSDSEHWRKTYLGE